jgi:hypothetical protein
MSPSDWNGSSLGRRQKHEKNDGLETRRVQRFKKKKKMSKESRRTKGEILFFTLYFNPAKECVPTPQNRMSPASNSYFFFQKNWSE